jgi:hypothetical protein
VHIENVERQKVERQNGVERQNVGRQNVENKTSIYKTSTRQNVDKTKRRHIKTTTTKRRNIHFDE